MTGHRALRFLIAFDLPRPNSKTQKFVVSPCPKIGISEIYEPRYSCTLATPLATK